MTQRTEEEKLRRKEAHRVSMVASGGLFVFMALAAGWVFFSKTGAPSFLLEPKEAALPSVDLPAQVVSKVAWRPWGKDVLAEAKSAGRPILLSVVSSSCYPCRLMDHRGYSDDKVAALVAARFVPARADAGVRPDLARRYVAYGLPTTAVLLPNGQILDSATYMEPGVLERWLTALADGWDKGRARAEASAAKALEERAKAQEPKPANPSSVAARARAELMLRPPTRPREPRFKRSSPLTLDDRLALLDGLLGRRGNADAAAKAALALDREFMDEKSGALFDRLPLGELPQPLDRILDPGLNFEAWRLYGRLADALAAGDPRRARFLAREEALETWLLSRAPWLDASERLMVATAAQRRQHP